MLTPNADHVFWKSILRDLNLDTWNHACRNGSYDRWDCTTVTTKQAMEYALEE
jgi:hypothetical protein